MTFGTVEKSQFINIGTKGFSEEAHRENGVLLLFKQVGKICYKLKFGGNQMKRFKVSLLFIFVLLGALLTCSPTKAEAATSVKVTYKFIETYNDSVITHYAYDTVSSDYMYSPMTYTTGGVEYTMDTFIDNTTKLETALSAEYIDLTGLTDVTIVYRNTIYNPITLNTYISLNGSNYILSSSTQVYNMRVVVSAYGAYSATIGGKNYEGTGQLVNFHGDGINGTTGTSSGVFIGEQPQYFDMDRGTGKTVNMYYKANCYRYRYEYIQVRNGSTYSDVKGDYCCYSFFTNTSSTVSPRSTTYKGVTYYATTSSVINCTPGMDITYVMKNETNSTSGTITGASVKGGTYTYDGTAKTPIVTIPSGASITYSLNGGTYMTTKPSVVTPGTYTINYKIIKTGCNSLNGSVILSISKAPLTSVKASAGLFTYTGYEIKPTVTVTDSNRVLPSNCYSISYSANKSTGIATVTATGIGNYTGTVKTTFNIRPKKTSISVNSTTAKVATIKWKDVADETGYRVYMKSSATGSYTRLAEVNSSTYSFSKTRLTSGKTYYFVVRAYKKVGSTVILSSYSNVVAVKIK